MCVVPCAAFANNLAFILKAGGHRTVTRARYPAVLHALEPMVAASLWP